MKFGVIDIGSNSVRLMINVDGKTLYKIVKTTRLSENMGNSSLLQDIAMERTILALSFLVNKAKSEKVDKLYCFATAAVRKAKNASVFIDAVYNMTSIKVDILSGEDEARAGYLGALLGKDGGVIDIGGASTEISVVKNNKCEYSKSLYLGAVSITDKCGQDFNAVTSVVNETVIDYGVLPNTDYYAIGGTATSVASMLLELNVYDPNKVNGYCVNLDKLLKLQKKLYSMGIDERKKLVGLQSERAKVIASGVTILVEIMKKIGLEKVIISESDNLEGYLILKGDIK